MKPKPGGWDVWLICVAVCVVGLCVECICLNTTSAKAGLTSNGIPSGVYTTAVEGGDTTEYVMPCWVGAGVGVGVDVDVDVDCVVVVGGGDVDGEVEVA